MSEIALANRIYWSKSNDLPAKNEQWHVHTYCSPEVDDTHVLCEFYGQNSSGDFVFKEIEPSVYSNRMLKFDEDELTTMIFQEKNKALIH